MGERRLEPTRTELLERRKRAIRHRLEGICSHLPKPEFDSLVERMAALEIKYSLRREEEARLLGQDQRSPEVPLHALDDEAVKNGRST